jgi:hypothetical protein
LSRTSIWYARPGKTQLERIGEVFVALILTQILASGSSPGGYTQWPSQATKYGLKCEWHDGRSAKTGNL